jgi:hypothetical protein
MIWDVFLLLRLSRTLPRYVIRYRVVWNSWILHDATVLTIFMAMMS